MLKYFILGFLVKIITGLDDTITHIPILASVTKTRTGKIFFSIGTLLAIILAIILAIFFSSILKLFPYYRYIAATLIFALAIIIYFDLLIHKPRAKVEKLEKEKEKIIKNYPSKKRGLILLLIGFIASVATVIDDIIAYSPLFLENNRILTIAGILTATILEILLVIYASEKISKIKYKEEIASIGLLILGLLILMEII